MPDGEAQSIYHMPKIANKLRHLKSDVPDAHGGRRGVNSTSEVYIRNMFDAWLGYMTNAHAAMRAAS